MKDIMKQASKKCIFQCILAVSFIALNMYLLPLLAGYIGNIFDLLQDIDKNIERIQYLILVLLVISVLLLLVKIVWKYCITYVVRKFEEHIKNKLFEHILNVKMSELINIKNGEIMSYFVKDISELRASIHHLISYGSRIIFSMIFIIYSMVSKVDLKLTIVTVIPVIVTGFILVFLRKKIDESFKVSQKKFTNLSDFIQESIDAIKTVKAYSQEEMQINEFIKINEQVRKSSLDVDKYSALLKASINLCFGLCYFFSIVFGSSLVLNGDITIGSYVAFNAYIALFIQPTNFLPSLIARLKRGKIAYNRLNSLLNITTELKGQCDTSLIDLNFKGDIKINDLTFNYPQSLVPTLKNINIDIKHGETIGIIGKVASGKTTLMNLLVKLYPVARGKISINTKDINDISLDTLRENICYITQDNFLFSTTLKQNITLFRDIYSDKDIENSIKEAVIYDEIMQLPSGIDTLIGQRGVGLSGGQKQRVVISRAFLNRSSIVIFDDTFSALDNKTAQKLLRNIKTIFKDKTCIIISNKISDIIHADKILVFDDGEIVETGDHKSLLEKKSQYYSFYKQQRIKRARSGGELNE